MRLREVASAKAASFYGATEVVRGKFPDNAMDSIPLLRIVRFIEQEIEKFQPTIIYTHWSGDLNIDHRRTAEATFTASRPLPGRKIKKILSFEIPSSTEWGVTSAQFKPNYFIDITQVRERKISLLNFYDDEMRLFPHPRSYENVNSLAQIRGATVGVEAAEGFELIRYID